MPTHLDLAQQAFTASGLQPTPPYRTVEDALHYLTILLSLLPAEEQAGYLLKPAGANVAPLADGTFVSVGRICYPNGGLVKVMGDVPNGGPQWVAEVAVDPAEYRAFHDAAPPPVIVPVVPESVDLTTVYARLTRLEQALALAATSERVEQINARLELVDKASLKTITWPDYAGRNWAGLVISKPR